MCSFTQSQDVVPPPAALLPSNCLFSRIHNILHSESRQKTVQEDSQPRMLYECCKLAHFLSHSFQIPSPGTTTTTLSLTVPVRRLNIGPFPRSPSSIVIESTHLEETLMLLSKQSELPQRRKPLQRRQSLVSSLKGTKIIPCSNNLFPQYSSKGG